MPNLERIKQLVDELQMELSKDVEQDEPVSPTEETPALPPMTDDEVIAGIKR